MVAEVLRAAQRRCSDACAMALHEHPARAGRGALVLVTGVEALSEGNREVRPCLP